MTTKALQTEISFTFGEVSDNEKRDNKQCLFDTPRRVTVNNKRLVSKCKKRKKYICIFTKAMALLSITKRNYSNSIGP